MAIALSAKSNVTPPGGAYPYGDIKDNPGDNTGTPVNRAVYADFHQFFARLLDQGGIVANGLPDNNTNTYQYFLALIANIRATAASETQRGTAEIATQAETNTGTDDVRFVTPLKLATRTATETRRGVIEIATQGSTDAGVDDDSAVTPLKLKSRLTDEAWSTATLVNSWANQSGAHAAARYKKERVAGNFIQLSGLIKSGANGSVAFTLPSGYRPTKIMAFSCATDGTSAYITVDTSGNVGINYVGGTFYSLQNVRFPID